MSDNEKKGFKCSLCPKSYCTERGYKKHLAVHSDPNPASEIKSSRTLDDMGDHNLYICDVCDKTYKTKGGLRKHILSHTRTSDAEQASQDDGKVAQDSDELFHSTEDGIVEESYFEFLDEEEERARDEAIVGGSNQEPSAKKRRQQKPAVMKCKECRTSYQSLETYFQHVRNTHVLKDFYTYAPSIDKLKGECPSLAKVALEEIQSCNFSVGPAAQVAEDIKVLLNESSSEKWILLTENICEGLFSDVLSKTERKVLTPPQLRTSITGNLSQGL